MTIKRVMTKRVKEAMKKYNVTPEELEKVLESCKLKKKKEKKKLNR